MAMRWLEGELRKNGDIFDDLLADQIADRIESKGDIPLPKKEIPVTQRFSERARESLENQGMMIYELSGQSISTLRDMGYPFFSTWHQGNEELEKMNSISSEVAINPDLLFFPGSNDKTFDEQVDQVINSLSATPDSITVLGQAPDYLELAFLHFKATGERLFGEKYDYLYTVTSTVIDGQRINVGHFHEREGIVVNNLMSDRDYSEKVFAAPILIPSVK